MPELWLLNGKLVKMPDNWREPNEQEKLIEYEGEQYHGDGDYDTGWMEKIPKNASPEYILKVMEQEDPDLFAATEPPQHKRDIRRGRGGFGRDYSGMEDTEVV